MRKKFRSRKHLAETITDADDEENLTPLANTPAQSESLLHSLEKVVGSIGSIHMF